MNRLLRRGGTIKLADELLGDKSADMRTTRGHELRSRSASRVARSESVLSRSEGLSGRSADSP